MDRVTLQKGDAVFVRGGTTEDIEKVIDAFKSAGAVLSLDGWHKSFTCLQWSNCGSLTPCHSIEVVGEEMYSIDQVLNATNAQPPAPAIDVGSGEWNVEGLPPVGIECEFRHSDFGWTGCTTIGLFRNNMVCAPNGGGFYQGTADYFRPIQSERDKVIAAAINAVVAEANKEERDVKVLDLSYAEKLVVTNLYDSGYLTMPEEV